MDTFKKKTLNVPWYVYVDKNLKKIIKKLSRTRLKQSDKKKFKKYI